MANLFTGSDKSDDKIGLAGTAAERVPQTMSGFVRTQEREAPPGKPVLAFPKARRRYKPWYNPDEVTEANIPQVFVTSNNVMSAEEYEAAMLSIMRAVGFVAEGSRKLIVPAEVVVAFERGLSYAHAANSASVLTPGRATIHVAGVEPIYYAYHVLRVLGDNARRFFRTRADDTYRHVKALFDHRTELTDDEYTVVLLIEQVAHVRGLFRYPYLAFDTADFVSGDIMDIHERSMVAMSKYQILGNQENLADVIRAEASLATQNRAGGGAATNQSGPSRMMGVSDI